LHVNQLIHADLAGIAGFFKHAHVGKGRNLALHVRITYFWAVPAEWAMFSRLPDPELRLRTIERTAKAIWIPMDYVPERIAYNV
jgi:hypothetical protein